MSRGDLALGEPRARFLGALSQQCYLNEYVFDETAEEFAQADALQARILESLQRERRIDHAALALLASYRPLRKLDFSHRMLRYYRPGASDLLYPVIRLQLIAPAVEQELDHHIDRLTTIRDRLSQSVCRQYEANPYPRWLYMDHCQPGRLADYLQGLFPHLETDALPDPGKKPRTLIAGCGTGKQAISAAMRVADADVLAIDLSMPSLRYGVRMARELGVSNIRWGLADILELDTPAAPFDLIECVGVLHHLEDPAAGLHKLCRLLTTDGFMRLGLYSRRARRAVELARDWVRDRHLPPTLDGIRTLRRHVYGLPDHDPMKSLLRASDFYSTSECRDLAFHVREHQFDLQHIGRLLDSCGLELLGFEFADGRAEARYRAMFPADTSMRNLQKWHAVEDRNPDTFASMYQFWVRKT